METILAEKLETIITLGLANTRMRDFYDVHKLKSLFGEQIKLSTLKEALANTTDHRGTSGMIQRSKLTFQEIENSLKMADLWKDYQRKYDYARRLIWEDVVRSVSYLFELCQGGDAR